MFETRRWHNLQELETITNTPNIRKLPGLKKRTSHSLSGKVEVT